MKSLYAFGSGGGSSFPGSPVAGVYFTSSQEQFETVAQQVSQTPLSIVVQSSGFGTFLWGCSATWELTFLSGEHSNPVDYPLPSSIGDTSLAVNYGALIRNWDTGAVYQFDGTGWTQIYGG